MKKREAHLCGLMERMLSWGNRYKSLWKPTWIHGNAKTHFKKKHYKKYLTKINEKARSAPLWVDGKDAVMGKPLQILVKPNVDTWEHENAFKKTHYKKYLMKINGKVENTMVNIWSWQLPSPFQHVDPAWRMLLPWVVPAFSTLRAGYTAATWNGGGDPVETGHDVGRITS